MKEYKEPSRLTQMQEVAASHAGEVGKGGSMAVTQSSEERS